MPKQRRWAIKKQLEQAEAACFKAENYLVITGKEYEYIHPDYYQAFSSIVAALEKVRASITELQDMI